MNAIARYELDRACQDQLNTSGEYPGLGPTWVCEDYGHAEHVYNTCPVCLGNFAKRNEGTLMAAGVE